MKISRGEQIFIYRSEHQGTQHKSYYVDVQSISKRHVKAIDLNNNNIEKIFNTSRFLEILDIKTPDEVVEKRLKHHIDNYQSRQLPSSFSHGGFFSKAKGHVTPDGELVLNLRGSKETLERDVKVFKLIIYYINNRDALPMGKCKKFVKEATPILLNCEPYNLDDYAFSADGKKDLINGYKENINDSKEYLKEVIQICKDEDVDPNEDDEVQDLKKEIESDSKYLKIVRSDYRQELIDFLCREYYSKYDDSVFYDIARDFPIDFEKNPSQ